MTAELLIRVVRLEDLRSVVARGVRSFAFDVLFHMDVEPLKTEFRELDTM